MQKARLPSGGVIDRSRPLSFRFDRQSFVGYAGDTVASALLANGVSLVGRSFSFDQAKEAFHYFDSSPDRMGNIVIEI